MVCPSVIVTSNSWSLRRSCLSNALNAFERKLDEFDNRGSDEEHAHEAAKDGDGEGRPTNFRAVRVAR